MIKVDESFKYHNKVDSGVIRYFVIRTKHAMSTDVSGALKKKGYRHPGIRLSTIIRDRVWHWD